MQDVNPGQSPTQVMPTNFANGLQAYYIASFGKRVVNNVADIAGCFLLLYFLNLPVAMLAKYIGVRLWMKDPPVALKITAIIIWMASQGLYYGLLEHYWGRTLGKFLTRTIVISADGERPTISQIVARTLSRFIPFEPLSYLFGGSYPIGLHDSLSKTRVVDLPKSPIPNP
jgi:uncharacterized RDD family membrane protein YckC